MTRRVTRLDAAGFGRLLHAYGWATDTPAHLAALADGDEILGTAVYGRAIAGCRDVTPAIATAAVTALSDEAPTVRAAAAHAIGAAQPPGQSLPARLDAGPDERAALVLAMGELGLDLSPYLRGPALRP
jgi:hypothetical protein